MDIKYKMQVVITLDGKIKKPKGEHYLLNLLNTKSTSSNMRLVVGDTCLLKTHNQSLCPLTYASSLVNSMDEKAVVNLSKADTTKSSRCFLVGIFSLP